MPMYVRIHMDEPSGALCWRLLMAGSPSCHVHHRLGGPLMSYTPYMTCASKPVSAPSLTYGKLNWRADTVAQ